MNLGWHPHALLILVLLGIGLVTALVNNRTLKRFDQFPRVGTFKRVSILVPARNEEDNIEACVRSLLLQDHPDFEVIVLDDHSSDHTLEILRRLAIENSHLKIIAGDSLPEGWLGKHWACHQLYQAASGELLLFTDADTRHAPNMLIDSVSALQAENADLATAFPKEEVVSLGERLIVPVISFLIFTFIPIRLVQRFRLPFLSITIGQFMLFRREAYEAVGGYSAVRSEIVDDMQLGRRIIATGKRWRFFDGTQHVSCRMYRGFWEAVSGFGKNIFAIFDFRILPYFVGWSLVGMMFLEPVVSLLMSWLRHPWNSIPPEYAAISVLLTILTFMLALKRFKFPPQILFYYPISVALFILVAMRSFFQTATGTAAWKDRLLDKPAMRWL